MKQYRRPMVRCQCGTCVADRRAEVVERAAFVLLVLAPFLLLFLTSPF